MEQQQRDDGLMFSVCGASRSGKTEWIKQRAAAAARVLVWDIRAEWPRSGFECVRTIPELADRLRDVGTGPAKIAYFGSLSDFPAWAELAYLWIQKWPAVIVGDELADVTHAGKAPEGWGNLLRKGLYWGAHIYACTQRPQESDKTSWGNASAMICFRFPLAEDCDYMARKLGCAPERVQALPTYNYLERWQGETEIAQGMTEKPAQ